MTQQENSEQQFPRQQQSEQPGQEKEMTPIPVTDDPNYRPGAKLNNKVALITGGDSGIGKAVAVAFAKEGANIAIVYRNEHEDAHNTQESVRGYGQRAILLAGDVGDEAFCKQVVEETVRELGTAEQVAQLVLFLASDESSHISGTEMWIDGTESLLMG